MKINLVLTRSKKQANTTSDEQVYIEYHTVIIKVYPKSRFCKNELHRKLYRPPLNVKVYDSTIRKRQV